MCRLVRTNITQAADPASWQVVLPENEKDLLSSASALKVRCPALPWIGRSAERCFLLLGCRPPALRQACMQKQIELLPSWIKGPGMQSDPFCTHALAQGDALVVTYMRDVATVLQLRSLSTGALVRELPMPGYGSIKEFCGRTSLSQFYYSFQSMTDPGSTYWCGFMLGV